MMSTILAVTDNDTCQSEIEHHRPGCIDALWHTSKEHIQTVMKVESASTVARCGTFYILTCTVTSDHQQTCQCADHQI